MLEFLHREVLFIENVHTSHISRKKGQGHRSHVKRSHLGYFQGRKPLFVTFTKDEYFVIQYNKSAGPAIIAINARQREADTVIFA